MRVANKEKFAAREDAIKKFIGAYCKVMDIKKEPGLRMNYFLEGPAAARIPTNLKEKFSVKPTVHLNGGWIEGKGNANFLKPDLVLSMLVHELEHINNTDKRFRPIYAALSPVVKGRKHGYDLRKTAGYKQMGVPLQILAEMHDNAMDERISDDTAEFFLETFKVSTSQPTREMTDTKHRNRGDYYATKEMNERVVDHLTKEARQKARASSRQKLSDLKKNPMPVAASAAHVATKEIPPQGSNVPKL